MPRSTHTPDYAVLLTVLRELRESCGLLQAELAERLDTSQSYVSKCENGERRLDVIELRNWCVALGVGFPDFVAELDKRLRRKR